MCVYIYIYNYTFAQSALEDSDIFGPNPWQTSWIRNSCYANWV